MRSFLRQSRATENKPTETDGILAQAVIANMAVIWFTPDGKIIEANDIFCDLMGYDKRGLPGQAHSIFCTPDYADSREYQSFWERLRAGKTFSDVLPRVTKSGDVVFIRGTYFPVLDRDGTVQKIVKFATNVTEDTQEKIESSGKIEAISRSQAVIEFDLNGYILTANENFLNTVQYSLDEIVGQHHSMFVHPHEVNSAEYKGFWSKLAKGEFASGDFHRRRKDGCSLYLSATYNPIFDAYGKPYKVVKFARDITEQTQMSADMSGQVEALGKSNAVIEFDPQGKILKANDNFLQTLDYSLEEIVGQKHALFVPEKERNSPSYITFWKDLAAGKYHEGEFRRIAKGGREIWIEGTYNPIAAPDGTIYKIVKFARDVTDRKRAVDSLLLGLKKLSAGDLTAKIETDLSGEFDLLRVDFNSSVGQLKDVVSQVLESSGAVSLEVEAISSSTFELSKRTERQAANLEETAAAMEQLASSVENATGSAKEAQGQVVQANSLAQNGGKIVASTVAAMADISNSSEQVSKIISVIDEIAFQTNLLALNAGVEAARAGESGRGFAVVASEVRALAQRSSDAAREIADLISLSSQQVKKGVDLVGQTGASLEEICESVGNVMSQVECIARLSDEQRLAITEINTSVSDIDHATQENAAMFEEVTASTRSVTNTAKALIDSTSAFHVGDQPHAPADRNIGQSTISAPNQPTPGSSPRTAAPTARFNAGTSGANALALNTEADQDDWEDF